jgi:hypothetical protein
MATIHRLSASLRRALNAYGIGDDAWQAASFVGKLVYLLLFGVAIIGPYSIEMSFAGRTILVLLLLAIAATAVNQWGAHQERHGRATYDMHPKDAVRYLWRESEWGKQFWGDATEFLRAVQMPMRDQLRSGGLKAQARPSGKWGSGEFRYPADILDRNFWAHGDLDWWRLINKEYNGDIGASSRGYGGEPPEQFDDVRLSKKELISLWPRRSSYSRWRYEPAVPEPFATPNYGPPPWSREVNPRLGLDELFYRLMTKVETFTKINDRSTRIESIDLALRDALSLGRLSSFGRPAGDWIGRLTDELATIRQIETLFWSDGGQIEWTSIDETAPRQQRCVAKSNDGSTYYDLQFDTAQVEKLWPT